MIKRIFVTTFFAIPPVVATTLLITLIRADIKATRSKRPKL